jgi:hypothetical protein
LKRRDFGGKSRGGSLDPVAHFTNYRLK